jgi:hypothetical protein
MTELPLKFAILKLGQDRSSLLMPAITSNVVHGDKRRIRRHSTAEMN